MKRSLHIGGILLAAGSATRFGSDKRLAGLADGSTLLARALSRLREAVDELVLVIGAADRESEFRARFPGVRVLASPRSAGGLGYSLADAVQQLGDWDGCLVALADKPFVRADTVRSVRERLATHTLVVPTFDGEYGHPVGFMRQHFRALSGLSGERGARALIDAERDRGLFFECGDPGVLADVDTPEQLSYWRGLLDD